ncbi:hypothetical protein Sked_02980 [Sanguibacter keddieii DSM 10542]|uniref:DUF2971 domain-containing protein n=1 Tax=Sanguibacter keddieii (strain ATCC 51767 / DSM 10542 / NCFB 3025 / ST-74) TaxID=446469 RepID=D1BJL1_SANKS|nr:DUF2971 domain-containing protein [Sanguibacter keddieii]ACZ20267.1 hypothetical protein Sked_02980 [Sanguibacter keddieii DSM 10542]
MENSHAPVWTGLPSAPSVVFHYTSAHGFLGMVQSGQLWATEASGLNDYSEIKEGESYIGDRWREERERFTGILGREKADIVDEFLSGSIVLADGLDGVFVACASACKDDANQWRLYADNGRGFSVELDTSVRLEISVPGQSGADHDPEWDLPSGEAVTEWAPVMYDKDSRNCAFEDLVTWASGIEDSTGGRHSEEDISSMDRDSRYIDNASRLGLSISRLAQFVKGPGFSGENESRLVVTPGYWTNPKIISFRASTVGIVRYLCIQAAETLDRHDEKSRGARVRTLPIRSITVGPAQNFELVRPSLEALLDRYGYRGVEIKRSTTSLRWT